MTAREVADAIRRELRLRRLSPFRAALDAELPGTAIRHILEGRQPRLGRLVEICDALDLELYVGPPRGGGESVNGPVFHRSDPLTTTFSPSVSLPVHQWMDCSPEGFLVPEPGSGWAPAPEALADPHAFYAREPGHSMVPAGLEAGNYCLISPCARVCPGDRVWLRNSDGLEVIRWLLDLKAATYELRAWWPPDGSGQQTMLADAWMREDVVDRGVVLTAYRAKPNVLRPPLQASRWQPDRVRRRWRAEVQTAQRVAAPRPSRGSPTTRRSLVRMREDLERITSEIRTVIEGPGAPPDDPEKL